MCRFGTPDWLLEGGGFASPDFPDHLADYIEVFARRYTRINWYTILNEPLNTARFCGREGFWHPFRKDGFELIGDRLVAAINESARRIREIRSHALMMQNDACEYHYQSGSFPGLGHARQCGPVRLGEERPEPMGAGGDASRRAFPAIPRGGAERVGRAGRGMRRPFAPGRVLGYFAA